MGNNGRFSSRGKLNLIPKQEPRKQDGFWKDAGGWPRSEIFPSKLSMLYSF